MNDIQKIAAASVLATMRAFVGVPRAGSAGLGFTGDAATDSMWQMATTVMHSTVPKPPQPTDPDAFPIKGDPYKPGIAADKIVDVPSEKRVYVRSGKESMSRIALGDWLAYDLTAPEMRTLRDLEYSFGKLDGFFGGVPGVKAFFDYVAYHDPKLAKKLRDRKKLAKKNREKGMVSHFSFNMRKGVDWKKVAAMAAIGAAAFFVPLWIAAAKAGGGAAVASAAGSGTAATGAGTAATLAPITLPASAVPITATATTAATGAGAAATTAKVATAAKAAGGAAALKPLLTPDIALDDMSDIVSESGSLTDKIINGVNRTRTVNAIANGEVPPPPISVGGDSFTDYAMSLAEAALQEKMQRELRDMERAQLDAEIRAMQNAANRSIQESPYPYSASPNPNVSPEVQRLMLDSQLQAEDQSKLLMYGGLALLAVVAMRGGF